MLILMFILMLFIVLVVPPIPLRPHTYLYSNGRGIGDIVNNLWAFVRVSTITHGGYWRCRQYLWGLLRISTLIPLRVLVVPPIPSKAFYVFLLSYPRGYWLCRQYPRVLIRVSTLYTRGVIGGLVNTLWTLIRI